MAKTIADLETSATGNERAQETLRLRELLEGGGSAANVGRDTEPGTPAGTSAQPTRPVESARGAEGGQGGSRYGETTGLVGYDLGEGKNPQEMNTPPSAPRSTGKTEGHHEESGTETSRNKG